ncbi:MAG: peptidoglycan DD-metalloendopeptidase family protein [Pseudanabaenaceae cyanobacterium SKYGB_i_bin29]|nr:peptidoglycan DD-metalloendopeptidase family protein [Pseudanabaenaceae cyanobacterium SKYG29]MDW8420297.1 peptidoglycan DD-metalloendopeptidase family protein [Pseudanabaenaceae cyanobacterium SKYGB_i_bin29]
MFFCCTGSVRAISDLDQYQRFLEYQKQQIQQRQDRIDRLTAPAQKRLEELQANINKTETYLEENEQRLEQIRRELGVVTERYQNLKAVFQRTKARTIARLRFLQRQPPATWWLALLGSDSLTELLDRRHQLLYLHKKDKDLLAQLKTSADQVLAEWDKVKSLENEALLVQQQLNYQKQLYTAEAETQKQIIDRLQKDRAALERAEERLLEDSRRLAGWIRDRSGDGYTLPPGNGYLAYPTYGAVTSPYGWRTHPILGYEKFHTGIDFGADYGTPIYAAQTGTVIWADWYGGYGNTIVIDHSNGIATLYAHLQSVYVQPGETVERGQVIGEVGSTGFSTGPHLHFELRVQGEPIDPAPYL